MIFSSIETGIAQFNSILYATFGGLFVGGLMKLINNVFDRRKNQLEEHVVLRKELREELDAVKTELSNIQHELDDWKLKYYQQVELTNELKVDILKLTEELSEYKRISGIFPVNNNGWFDTTPES
jgi:predicted  nucleic acid-binding Zn-ribbon protein